MPRRVQTKESVLLSVRAEGSAPDDHSQVEAVRYALALCRDLGARLTVLAVAEQDWTDTHWLCVQERLREETRTRALKALGGVRVLAEHEGVECLVESRVGDFYDTVEAYARDLRPHLLIIACPLPPRSSLRWCQEVSCLLRAHLHCPVVSLVPWGPRPQKA